MVARRPSYIVAADRRHTVKGLDRSVRVAIEASMTATPSGNQSDWLSDFPPPRSLPLDQEALRVYERAYHIGLSTEKETEPPITFSTVALALLTGQDETSQWFARLAAANGPLLDMICSEKGTTSSTLSSAVYPTGRPAELRLSSDKQLLTVSARVGARDSGGMGESGRGLRHRRSTPGRVLRDQSTSRAPQSDERLGLQRARMAPEFFAWIGGRYTAEAWTDASQKVAPTKAVASFEQVEVKGEALAFPGDEQAMASAGARGAVSRETTRSLAAPADRVVRGGRAGSRRRPPAHRDRADLERGAGDREQIRGGIRRLFAQPRRHQGMSSPSMTWTSALAS